MKNIFWVFIGCSTLAFSQQDAQFTQYMFNHLSVNPAYAGTREVMDVSVIHRRQWSRIEGGPVNSSLVLQMPLGKKKAGFGVEMSSEKIGPKSIGSLKGSYSYRIKLGSGKLAFGLKLGMSNYQYDWGKIKYRDQNDPYAQQTQESWMVFSADYGMYYYTKSLYAGICITHLNQDNLYNVHDSLNEGTQVPHIFAPFGVGIQVNENFIINPSVMLKMAPAAPMSIDLNCNFLIDNKLWLGVGARSGNGISILAMWNMNNKMRMGYSYDYGMNKIGVIGRGAHELVLGYGLGVYTTKTLTPRYL